MKRAQWLLLAALAGPAAPGCVGLILEPPGSRPSNDGGTTYDTAVVLPDGAVVNRPPELPSPASRYPRLSHMQWENTTQRLLGFTAPSGLTDSFVNDARTGTFDNNGADLRVGGVLFQNYQQAAEALAERATQDAASLARVLPPGGLPTDATARARAFVEHFGQRAFRRPLNDAELTRYTALFARGPELFPNVSDAVTAGARLVITTMLQSPHFLYRVERSAQVAGDVLQPTAWEIASRLSYALWNTMPDDELFRLANSGELSNTDVIRAQVRRMLGDPRARAMVGSFHDQLLDTHHYLDVTRTDPQFTPELPGSMVEESRAFVQHVVFDANRGLRELLTASYTFVDARLARVYGLTGTFDDTFRRADWDPTRRAGILSQTGFLTVNAQGLDTDPIHRGVFVNRRILCSALPPPPEEVPPLPPLMGQLTMRQRIDMHTGRGTCGEGCHSTYINPIGFAFEHFDGMGRWRDRDNNLPIDATGEYTFQGTTAAYNGAVEFAREAARQRMTHQCYVRHWLEYAYARPPGMAERTVIERIADESLANDLPVVEVITQLVTSRAFLTRATQEAGM